MKPDPDYPMFLRNVGYMHGDPIPAGYVPVEPDYEAALDRSRQVMEDLGQFEAAVVAAVRAALGIGGSE